MPNIYIDKAEKYLMKSVSGVPDKMKIKVQRHPNP